MKKTHVFLKGTKEAYLHVLSFIPDKEPIGVVHILHGMGEHAGRYGHFAEYLTQQGYSVFAHDHRGHGKSLKGDQKAGILLKTDTFKALIDDVDVVRQHIYSLYPNLSIVMLGHSMGSIVLRRYLQRYGPTVNQAIIMGTLPMYGQAYTKLMRAFVFLAGLFKPANQPYPFLFELINKGLIKHVPEANTPFDWITQDEEVVHKYIEDPLSGYVYNKIFYREFFKTIGEVNRKEQLRKTPLIPTLMISGLLDPVGEMMKGVEKAAAVHRKVLPGLPLTVKGVENARHEVLNELNKQATYDYIVQFIKQP